MLVCAHCPANIFAVVVLLVLPGNISRPYSRHFILSLVLYQGVSLFGVHLLFARAIKVLYRPRRVLCSILARSSGCLKLLKKLKEKRESKKEISNRANKAMSTSGLFSRAHFTLGLLVHSFATDVRGLIGFTYGPFGQVTVSAFVRYVLLYGKFLLITHKWIRAQSLYQ